MHKFNSHSPIILFLLLFLFGSWWVLSGCSDDKIIEEDKLVLIYTDLLIARDTVSLNDKGLDSLRLSVLKKHNVSEKEYDETIKYYNEDSKRWEVFFDKVTAHLESLSQPSPKERAF